MFNFLLYMLNRKWNIVVLLLSLLCGLISVPLYDIFGINAGPYMFLFIMSVIVIGIIASIVERIIQNKSRRKRGDRWGIAWGYRCVSNGELVSRVAPLQWCVSLRWTSQDIGSGTKWLENVDRNWTFFLLAALLRWRQCDLAKNATIRGVTATPYPESPGQLSMTQSFRNGEMLTQFLPITHITSKVPWHALTMHDWEGQEGYPHWKVVARQWTAATSTQFIACLHVICCSTTSSSAAGTSCATNRGKSGRWGFAWSDNGRYYVSNDAW